MRAQDRDTSPVERCAKRLGVAHDLGHVLLAEREHLGGGGCQGRHAVDLVSGRQDGEDGVGDGFGQLRVLPHDDAALRAAEGLARRSRHDGGALPQRVLKLAASYQPQLVRAIEEETASPPGDHLVHLAQWEREECHGGTQRDQLGAHKRGYLAEEVEVHFEFDGIERDVHDLEAAHTRRAVAAVTRVAAEGLGQAHDDIARFSKCRVDRHIADHAGYQPVVGVPRAKDLLQQFDAQGFDLVDVLGASKPAVHRADMPFGGADSHLGGEQRAHSWTGGRFRSEQVEALPPSPLLVTLNCRQHCLLHLLRRAAGVQHRPGISKDVGVMHFYLLRRRVMHVAHGMISSHRVAIQRTLTLLLSLKIPHGDFVL